MILMFLFSFKISEMKLYINEMKLYINLQCLSIQPDPNYSCFSHS